MAWVFNLLQFAANTLSSAPQDKLAFSSISTTAGRLYLFCVFHTRGTISELPTIIDANRTWTPYVSQNASATAAFHLRVFHHQPGANQSGGGTVDFNNENQTGCGFFIVEIYEDSAGIPIGNNGADALDSSVSGTVEQQPSLSLTLPETPATTDLILGFFGVNNDSGITPGSGFTEPTDGDKSYLNPAMGAAVEYRTGTTSTTVDASRTGTGDRRWAGIAFRVLKASGSTPVSQSLAALWESLTIVNPASAALWEALGLIQSGRLSLWESEGLLLSGRSGLWESLTPVTQERSGLYESLTPASQTRGALWESLGLLVPTSPALWESLGLIPSARLALWGSVGLTLSDRTALWESLEPAGSVSSSVVVLWESLGLLVPTSPALWESLTPASQVRSGLYESVAPVAQSQEVQWESLGLVAPSRVTLWESLAFASQSRVATWESLAPTSGSRVTLYESLEAIAREQAAFYESLGALQQGRGGLWESLALVSRERAALWESLSSSNVITQSVVVLWESGQLVQQARMVLWEARAAAVGVAPLLVRHRVVPRVILSPRRVLPRVLLSVHRVVRAGDFMELQDYQVGSQILIEWEARDADKESTPLFDPDTSVQITIKDRDKVAVVTEVPMVKIRKGIYRYSFQSSLSSKLGTYTFTVKSVHSGAVNYETQDAFTLIST